MKEFFLILFFSKTLLLTPDPVTISKEMGFHPSEPLSAITTGASIIIDVTNMLPNVNIGSSGIVESRRLIRERIPPRNIRARLIAEDETEVILSVFGTSLTHDSAWVTLSSRTGVPTDLEFKKVIIESATELNDVVVYWRNYRH